MRTTTALALGSLLIVAPGFVNSAELIIPRGTAIFGELEERVASNAKHMRVGREVYGHVWKDVVVDGHTVITAGTPMTLQVSKLERRSAGGGGATIEIMAVSVTAVDGTEITLVGGYDRDGGDRYGLTRALSYIVWPAAFLPGRRAVLEEGTVFDAAIPADTTITLPDDAVPTLRLAELPDLEVKIFYEEINQREGTLPMALTLCNQEFTREASVTSVNDKSVRPILVTVFMSQSGDPCHEFKARVNLETLTEHFTSGINRFAVTMAGIETSVVLNVEM